MEKYKLIHPYRHHSYEIINAFVNNGKNIEAILGVYDKLDIGNLFKIKFLKGYNKKSISKNVTTYITTNILFLLMKLKFVSEKTYISYFQKKAIKHINREDTVIFLQDYCQEIIDYCIKHNIDYIYDHIMPCGYEQQNLLIKSAIEYNFSMDYVDRYMSKSKIVNNYRNIVNAKIILNASKSTYNIVKSVLGKNNHKNFIVPYGANFKFFNDSYEAYRYIDNKNNQLRNRKLKILYVGSLSLVKGTDLLIDIIELNKDIEFGIVGIANSEDDEIFIKKLLGNSNVYYYGAIPHKDMKKIYMKYDAFLFTSRIEGFGMVTLEALAAGLPCIVNEFCPSVICNGENGFIIKNLSIKEYNKKINDLKNDLDKLNYMSKAAYKSSNIYDWNNYYKKLISILNRK
ncbi:MAG: glycosyltransferase family 4 protein [Clostridium perfringens]|nr:glycosyltransferase family 4 protein [Clostridium perfringens]